jgi:SAM-dependent methyltransferase
MTSLRHRIGSLLRKARLLTLADRAMFLGELLRTCRVNRLFRAEHPDFAVPPASLAFDAYHHAGWRHYYESGLLHARLIAELIGRHHGGERMRICEWGCGPGRVIRHLGNLLTARGLELFAADYNPESVAWCGENLPGIDFRRNRLEPPLPFDTETMDVLYSISVFTHLSAEAHRQWIDELLRVVRPAGIVIFTTHGDACLDRLLPREKESYRRGELVIRGGVREGKKCFLAYHPPRYVREQLLEGTTLLEHLPSPAAYQMVQDVWVARKAT